MESLVDFEVLGAAAYRACRLTHVRAQLHTNRHMRMCTYIPTYLPTYITVHYIAVRYSTKQYITVLHDITVHYITVQYSTLDITVQHIRHYSTVHDITFT